MKKKLVALILGAGLMLTSCGQETEKEAAVEITYESENDVITAPDGTEIYRYDYSYPCSYHKEKSRGI